MAAAVVNLVEAVVAAINAASLDEAFPKPVTAYEDYSLALAIEATKEWEVAVQPGPSRTTPATLDSGVSDLVSARVVVWKSMPPKDVDGIKAALLFVETILDEVCNRIDETYDFISSGPEELEGGVAEAYDPLRLRDDGVFHAQFLISFERVRDQ